MMWICGGYFRVVNRSVWFPEMIRYSRVGYVIARMEYHTSKHWFAQEYLSYEGQDNELPVDIHFQICTAA